MLKGSNPTHHGGFWYVMMDTVVDILKQYPELFGFLHFPGNLWL